MDRKETIIRIVRISVLVTGALFLVLGLLRGEPGEILTKAVRICLECIGIG